MPDIQFEEDRRAYAERVRAAQAQRAASGAAGGEAVPGMAGWIMRRGLARTRRTADLILFGIILLNFALAAWILSRVL